METNKDIGDEIKNRLQEYTKAPDLMVWNKIETELKQKNKNKFLFFLLSFTGLLLLSVGFFTINSISKNTNTIANQVKDSTLKKLTVNKNKLTKSSIVASKDTIKFNNKNNSNITVGNSKINVAPTNSSIKNKKLNDNKTTSNLANTKSQKNNFKKSFNNKSTVKTNEKYNSNNINLKSNTIENLKKAGNTKPKDTLFNKNMKDLKKSVKINKTDSLPTTKYRKWSITPFISLDYLGSFNHKTTKNTSTDFGFKLSYLATEDLAIRLGVTKLNLNFTTNKTSNSFSQKISYLELPLEFKQTLLKRKIRTSLIAGISFLILDNTSISNQNNTFLDSTTENNNMSINLGLGFDMVIYKRLKLNVEPIFKYHFNTLQNSLKSDTYTLSIIGGIEYQF